MQEVSESVITELLEEGNGSVRFQPLSGGEYFRVSYLWGKLRIDRVRQDGKIPAPALGVGGGGITPSPTD